MKSILRAATPFTLLCALISTVSHADPAHDRIDKQRAQELLFDAARIGRFDLVSAFATYGIDFDAYDSRGFTPLIVAAYAGQLEMIDALIMVGANPCKPELTQGNTALMGAAFRGHDAVAGRLMQTKCDINARNKSGQTALMMAAMFDRGGQIELMLAQGADASLSDETGRTAETIAKGQGNENAVKALSMRL